MKDLPNEADVLLGRYNLALARSQRILDSWLPQDGSKSLPDGDAQSEEEDFRGMDENAGLGSKPTDNGDDVPSGFPPRRLHSSQDKLLEQLLGKRAVEARKQAQSRQKLSSTQHTASVARPKAMKQVESDGEDEEGGRSAAFTHRRKGSFRTLDADHTPDSFDTQAHHDPDEPSAGLQDDSVEDLTQATSQIASMRTETRKRHAGGSYLDEVLGSRKKKKKKTKKKPPE